MKQFFIGIDLGSSGVRVEVYDAEGNLISVGKESISKQSVDEWLKAVKEAVPSIVKNCIDCEKHVSITSTSGTLLGVDDYGNVVFGPVMYYERDDEVFEVIKNFEAVKKLANRSVKLDPTSPIVKIYRLKVSKPELYNKIRWFVSPTTYLLYRFLYREGEIWDDICMDYTNSLKFGLDILSSPPTWVEDSYLELGLDISKLPKPVPAGDRIGIARSRYAEELGLRNAVLYQGLTDGNASALAGGAIDVNDTSIYSGSTTVPKIVVDRIIPHPALYYHIHPIKGFLAGSATGFTGAFLSWFAEKVLGTDLEKVAEYLDKVEAGTEYLFFPYGDRSPFYDSSMQPALVGLRIIDEPREIIIGRFVRSIMLGIALLENYYLDLFEELFSLKIGYVHLTGGGTRSKLWNKIRASLYERKVAIYGDLVGPGIIAPFLIRNKFYNSIEELKQKFIKPIENVEPDEGMVKAYKHYKQLFVKKWAKLLELYKA
ncbi:MAG: FGGY-family carbohydrate kinase [Ignisphaera sp.]